MKKLVSILMAALLLLSLCGAATADSLDSYTPEDVLQWLDENDQAAETADDQVMNGAMRMTEMFVFIAGINANEEQKEVLEGCLDRMDEMRSNADYSYDQRLAISFIETVHALEILTRQADPNGQNQESADILHQAFIDGDDTSETPVDQAVSALYSAVKFASFAAKERCTSQDQIDQIDAALDQVAAEDETTTSFPEQLQVGSKWLYKMFGAFVKLMDDSKIQYIENLTNNTENGIETQSALQATARWMYSTVYAGGVLTGFLTID